MNLSFAGCGFLGMYHVGVAVCFKKYAPHLLLNKISGASAGALAACCLLCDMPLAEMTNDFLRIVKEARSHSLGPFSPSFNIQTCLLEGLQKQLPSDAHLRVTNRLHISVTRVYDGKNVIISKYTSRDDVLQALLCACFIPGFSGILPPKFHGVRYMDGAFSDNLPVLDENTVTVSPFCGESDICPRDQSSQLFHINWANTSIEISKQNMNRFTRILFPPSPEVLSKTLQQGFDDAMKFLYRNNLISCTRCVAVQSTFLVSETIQAESYDYDPECTECKKHRKEALVESLPETVLNVIQNYIDSANKGLANWILRRRGIKLLKTLSLPATVPADILYATIIKLIVIAPIITSHFLELTKILLEHLNEIIKARRINTKKNYMNISNTESDTLNGQYINHFLSIMVEDGPTDVSYPSNFYDVDTFDHILKITSQHDAVYAYYYMDDINNINITQIFDISENKNSQKFVETKPNLENINEDNLNERRNNWNNSPEFTYQSDDENGIMIEEQLSGCSDPEDDRYISQKPENIKRNSDKITPSSTLDMIS